LRVTKENIEFIASGAFYKQFKGKNLRRGERSNEEREIRIEREKHIIEREAGSCIRCTSEK
jgi:hypothetical protein